MRHICGISVLLLLGMAFAQENQPPAAKWPTWLKLGGEFRARLEMTDHANFERGNSDRFYLNRVRLNAGIEPRPWLRFFVEGQDARSAGFNDPEGLGSIENHFDFRQAYASFGSAGSRWEMRVGRQELALGDERLVGADSYWDPLGRSWDAARLTYHVSSIRLDWFASWLVPPDRKRLDRLSSQDRFYGFYARLPPGPGGLHLEPYFFFDELMRRCQRGERCIPNRVYTPGARFFGDVPGGLDYNVEMAFQRGISNGDKVVAWAGHWEVGYKLGRDDRAPRASVEYNYASGDSRPGDGRHTTFDDLHPAGYNKFGMADPFAWRNIRSLSGAWEWPITGKWRVFGGYRAFWLASPQDGLYTVGEECLTRDPAATASHVGNQASFAVVYAFSEHWHLHGGYARFFPGAYLRQAAFNGPFSTPFLMLRFQF